MKSRGNSRSLNRGLVLLPLLALASSGDAAQIKSIEFKNQGQAGYLEIKADGPISAKETQNKLDRQIVVDLEGATLSKSASRKLDTSSFPGAVSLVSPYQVQGQDGLARVVVQLREEPKNSVLEQDGNTVRLVVSSDSITASRSASQPTGEPINPPELSGSEVPASPPVAENSNESTRPSVQSTTSDGMIDGVISANQTKRYVGKPINLQVRDMNLLDVFQLIGEASGFNVVVGPEVSGKITLNLAEVPWDQALDLILSTRQLGAERKNNILRITTLENLTREKQSELAAKRAAEATAPKVTKVFPISYAKLPDIVTAFKNFGSNLAAQDAQTVVQPDDRTNSIIVRDTVDNVERMKKIVEVLDVQTPQVLIEAKVIEASETFGRSLGGSLGMGRANEATGQGFGTSFNTGALTGSVTNRSSAEGTGALGITLLGSSGSNFNPFNRINALLTIGEEEEKVKVIASPRLVVLNKESASIVSGTPVVLKSSTVSNGTVTNTTATLMANLSLTVSPTVTNDLGVLMTLSISRDVPLQEAVAPRTINTKVLVDSGGTLVIGGIYTAQENESSSGFPFLRKIPILGWFFGTESKSNTKSELFIFISPRVLNEKDAGLSG
jgi:type IV pilus assembly protein PilQ